MMNIYFKFLKMKSESKIKIRIYKSKYIKKSEFN